jgi:tetratricopeptide (TPR) repeat protein
MEAIPLFNPYTMSDDQLLKVQTAHETDFKKILSIIQNNQQKFDSKHIVINGSAGAGKSFLLRRLQIHFKPYQTIAFLLFPEVPLHMFCANDFLKHIQQFLFVKNSAFEKSEDDTNTWEDNCRLIEQQVKKLQYNHIILGIENLHLLLSDQGIFFSQKDQLQNFLKNTSWLTLITTHSGQYAHQLAAFFDSLYQCDLSDWTDLDHEKYIHKIFTMHQPNSDGYPEIKQNAVRQFTGGLPRHTAIMADILRHKDIFATISALETKIDCLTPYFQNQFFSLASCKQLIIVALIHRNTPSTIPELADQIHLNETDISQHIDWLIEHEYLNEISQTNNTIAYALKNRLFVLYYRMRHGTMPDLLNKRTLAHMSEFLTTFYENHDLIKMAQKCFSQGNTTDARELLHIILSQKGFVITQIPWKNDIPLLFQAIDICFFQDFQLSKSEKKAALIHQQIRDLIEASQYLPNGLNISQFSYLITGNLFINEKTCRFLFQKCICNHLSHDQWIDLDLFFARQHLKMRMAYGDFLMPLLNRMKNDEIIPDVIREVRMNRLKQNDPDIYYALIAFCIDRLPFSISCAEQLEAHRNCLRWTKDITYQVVHLEQIGWHLGCLKKYDEAIAFFQKALDIRKKQNNFIQQAWISGQLGWCHQLLKAYDISYDYHKNACKIYHDATDFINYAWNLGCIGRIHGKCGRYEAALKKHQHAIDMLEDHPDIKQIAWNWSRIARNQTCLKRYDKAMNAHQTALELLEQDSDNDLKAWNLEGLAWIYGKVAQHDDAIKTQQQALKYRSQEGNISQQAWNLEGIGWSLGKLGRFEEALKVLNRALKVREKTNHQKGQAWNLEGIARFLGRLGRHDEALVAHERALIIQKNENNHERQIWNYRGMAWNHKEMKDYEQSIHILKHALEFAEKSENKYWQAALWALIGWDYHQIHQLADAIMAHEMAISFYQTLNNDAGVMENAGQIAINYFILGQTGRAWNVLDHYGTAAQCPNKIIARLGEVIIYLIRNVRQNMAYRTAVNIIEGLLLRRNQWDISSIFQMFLLSLILSDLEIGFIHKVARYIKKRFQADNQLLTIFDLIEYIYLKWQPEYLAQLDVNRRQAVESLIDAMNTR